MGTKAAISEKEYLHTSFPGVDCEYRDGELVERTLPGYIHGRTQGLIFMFFDRLRKQLSVFASVETRVKLREGVYLIPDVSVFWPTPPASAPDSPPPGSPPLVAIEVLSPDDRMSVVREKLQEYRALGVGHVWLVDPHSRRLSPAI